MAQDQFQNIHLSEQMLLVAGSMHLLYVVEKQKKLLLLPTN